MMSDINKPGSQDTIELHAASKQRGDTKATRNLVTKKRLTIFLILIALTGLAAWQSVGIYTHGRLVQMVPNPIRQSIDFPIFLPTSTDVVIDQSSFDLTSGILQFKCTVKGMQIAITEQAKTNSFNLDNFTKSDNISGAETVTIPTGKVLMGKIGSLTVVILETNQTIVTITSTQDIPRDELKSVVNSLKQI